MPLAPVVIASIIGAGGAVAGGALSSHSKQTTATTPTIDPKYSGLQDLVLQSVQKRLAAPSTLPAGFEASGIKNINQTYDAIGQSLDNSLSARGLSGSPVAGAGDTKLQIARGGKIADFSSQLPMFERELQNNDLGLAGNILAGGRGSTTTGTGTTGGGAAGGFTNLAQMLGYLTGKGVFGQPTGTPGATLTPGTNGIY